MVVAAWRVIKRIVMWFIEPLPKDDETIDEWEARQW